MKYIYLTQEEKQVFLHVIYHNEKQPKNITPAMFHFCLSTLKEKGLVDFRANCDTIIRATLTIKGKAYYEQNPKLKNPIDWHKFITLATTIITALATTIALFLACCFL